MQCGGSAESALPQSPGAVAPRRTPHPFPGASQPAVSVTHTLPECVSGMADPPLPSLVLRPAPWRELSLPRWAPPFPAPLTQCSGSRRGVRGRGEAPGLGALRGGC